MREECRTRHFEGPHAGGRGPRHAGGRPGLALPLQRGGDLRRRAGDLRLRLTRVQRGPEQAQQLQADIRTADRRLEGRQMARREIGRPMWAGDLPEEDHLQALATPMRDLFDALRMIVHQAETRPAAALAPGLSRPETARRWSRRCSRAMQALCRTRRPRLPPCGCRIRPAGDTTSRWPPAGGAQPDPNAVPADQSAPDLRDPPARTRRQARVCRRLCRPVPAGQGFGRPRIHPCAEFSVCAQALRIAHWGRCRYRPHASSLGTQVECTARGR